MFQPLHACESGILAWPVDRWEVDALLRSIREGAPHRDFLRPAKSNRSSWRLQASRSTAAARLRGKFYGISAFGKVASTIAVCEHLTFGCCAARAATRRSTCETSWASLVIESSHGLELVFGRSDVLRLRRGMNLPRNLNPWRSHDASCNRSSSVGSRNGCCELGQR